jgi:gas vesicle protein GvpL/GvpF
VDDRALYVYGVVPGTAAGAVFVEVRGVDPGEPVVLVDDGGVAAIASAVRLDEFGEDAIQENLRDPRWLAEKARAHDDVLAAAAAETTVLPFRFGAIYRDEEHVVALLRDRVDFASALDRLEGAVELGVSAFADVSVLRARLASTPGGDEVSAGRAYMQRKQAERELDDSVGRFTTELAQAGHERLAALAREARLNPVRRADDPGSPRRMILNAAYLVDAVEEQRFRDEVAALASDDEADGVDYELTGPWPPYNFADPEDGS